MLSRLVISANPLPRPSGPGATSDVLIDPEDRAALAADFPTIEVSAVGPALGERCVTLDPAGWRSAFFDFYAVDALMEQLDQLGDFTLRISAEGREAGRTALEALTRHQRFVRRRNKASQGAVFDRVLARHRALHALDKPLVRADYDHALDAWQWLLRLDPEAGAAVQIAALFHDVERLSSEADERVEHKAPDYQKFKDAHARRGAELTREALADVGLDAVTLERAALLVASHERPRSSLDADPRFAEELLLLNDADALSFFSLNSAGYLRYFGLEQTRRKVAYTFNRLRPSQRGRLRRIRYHRDVEELVLGELASRAAAAVGIRVA